MLKSDTKLHVEKNPFDAKKGIVLGIPKRLTILGKIVDILYDSKA